MEKPMFYQGQMVVCVDGAGVTGKIYGCVSELIEGKKYIVSNSNAQMWKGMLHIELQGLRHRYNQEFFIPYEADQELENEIHEAMKGRKITHENDALNYLLGRKTN